MSTKLFIGPLIAADAAFQQALVLGFIDDNKFPLVPLIAFLFTFCLAVPLGLLAKSKKAIEDLQERVSELEKR